MGLRIPPSAWLQMTPQQQFLASQGMQPAGMPDATEGDAPMPLPQMTTPEQQKAMAGLQAAQLQSVQDQKQGINNLQDYAAGLQGQEVQTNLSPLVALTDSWTGSKLLPGYQVPESGAQKMDKVAALKQAINKEKGTMSAEEINLLKAKINAMTTQSIFGQKQAGAATEKDDKEAQNATEDRGKILKTDQAKIVQGVVSFNHALNRYEDILSKYPPGQRIVGKARQDLDSAYSQLEIKYKEAANLGALSGGDIKIVKEGLAPTTGLDGVLLIGKGGDEGMKAAFSNLRSQTKKDFDINTGAIAAAYGKHADPMIKEYKNQFGKVYRGDTGAMSVQAPPATTYTAGVTKKKFRGQDYIYQGGDPIKLESWVPERK